MELLSAAQLDKILLSFWGWMYCILSDISELQDELSLITLFEVGTVRVFPQSVVGVGVVEEVGFRVGVTDAALRWARGDAANSTF